MRVIPAAPISPSGRPTASGFHSSATSTAGTEPATHSKPKAKPGSGKRLSPASARARCTSFISSRASMVTAPTRPIRSPCLTRSRPRAHPSFGISITIGTIASGSPSGKQRNGLDKPMAIYEMHLGSWRRVAGEGNRSLSYRELAPLLADYLAPAGLHPCGALAGDGSSVFRLLGLSNHRLLRARRETSARRRT